MARIADKIKTIDGSKETLKLAVRITELWFVGTPGRSEQAEMIIVDSNGDQIHVVCKQDQLKAWKMDLKEGCTYVMHNFRVTKNDEQLSELGIEIRSILTRRSQWSSQPSGSAQLSSRETFISKLEAKSISEINNLCEDGDLDLNASQKHLINYWVIYNRNMENHRFISKSDSAKVRSNRKRIRQQKVHLDVQHSVHASLNPASSHTEDDYN
ncbi:hypothetical protein JHK82_012189 [Glycine max]|nr:hypothetical protein JHK85_012525 [Glycine max]KAG5057195.1 hypothetical protein JHK86_012191 [Glycine max]KAG5154220.1 hypothetical protein JHK82_012189 [Glycine max]